MDFCTNCGDGITLGHKCVHCGNFPFCDKPSCSETSEQFKRICTDCIKDQELDCLECSKLADGACAVCFKLKERGVTTRWTRACEEHIKLFFYHIIDSSVAFTLNCTKCCKPESIVCRSCAIPKQSFWSGNKFICKNCGNDLRSMPQMVQN